MKYLIWMVLLVATISLNAQSEGYINYEQVISMTIELPEEMKQYQAYIPTEKKSLHELQFNATESLYQKQEEVKETADNPFAGNGVDVQIVTMGDAGGVGALYYGFAEAIIVKTVDMMGKLFLVEGPYEKADWKVLGEQKEILGYTCIKAERLSEDNPVTAWFTPQIPLPIGPNEWVGLPGAVLEVETNGDNAAIKITATEVNLKPLGQPVTRPQKGKKVTPEGLSKIQEQRMEEMEKMYGGERSEDGTITIHRIEGGN